MKSIKRLLCSLLLPVFLFGCASAKWQAYSRIEQEYQELKARVDADELTKEECYVAYAELFHHIAEGSAADADAFAKLVTQITGNSGFESEEVFTIAEDYATLFAELASGDGELGIRDIEVESAGDAARIAIAYLGEIRYSVKLVNSGGNWNNGQCDAPYAGELGKYLVEIAFYDTIPCSEFNEKYPHGSVHGLGILLESELRMKVVYTADHGYMIYIGCDVPLVVEERPKTAVSSPVGTVSVQAQIAEHGEY